jgi:CheY-like chemotaxis protein
MQKILVIDDDPVVRKVIVKILERHGYQVVSAEDGRRGLAVFRTEQPDLVITDMIMPEKEGIETIREICRQRPDARIVAISGGGRIKSADFLAMAKKLGATDVLAKPFEPAALLGCVARCLARIDVDTNRPNSP